jgi:hypothetical protein
MKKNSRKLSGSTGKTLPTPDQIRRYIECSADEHQFAWHHELLSDKPHWVFLIGLHLRLVELDHLEAATKELL